MNSVDYISYFEAKNLDYSQYIENILDVASQKLKFKTIQKISKKLTHVSALQINMLTKYLDTRTFMVPDYIQTVDMLIPKMKDINEREPNEEYERGRLTIIERMCEFGRFSLSVIQHFEQKGCRLDGTYPSNSEQLKYICLISAVKHCKLNLTEYILNKYPKTVNSYNILNDADSYCDNKSEILDLLILKGAK